LAINSAQVVISVLIIVLGARATRFVVTTWEEGQTVRLLFAFTVGAMQYLGLNPDLNQIGPIVCEKLDTSEIVAEFLSSTSFDQATCEAMSQVAIDALSERASTILYPLDKSMVTVPLVATVAIGAVYTLFLASIFIPSIVSTTLRFRSGNIPFYDSANHFLVYRERLDRPSELVGTMLWVTILGPLVFGAFFGVFLFLMMWQVTRGFMLRIIASALGICITFCIRWAFGLFYVDSTLKGFYRKRVNQNNLGGLAVECIMVGLGIALAAFRALVCLSISLLYIARADRILFDSEITIGLGHPLLRTRDHLPVSFRKEILLQEAHRHPYIEVLGKAYIMKLRHRNSFASNAGCCMRIIFTEALMPWLRSYRDMARQENASSTFARKLWTSFTLGSSTHPAILDVLGSDNPEDEVELARTTQSRLESIDDSSSHKSLDGVCLNNQ